jgi:hypothetical protein
MWELGEPGSPGEGAGLAGAVPFTGRLTHFPCG